MRIDFESCPGSKGSIFESEGLKPASAYTRGEDVSCCRQSDCKYYEKHGNCSGGTYQHIWEKLKDSIDRLSRLDDDLSRLTVEILREIDDETYKRCSNQNRGSGGRTGIDVTLRRCLKDKLGIKVMESGHTFLQGDVPVKHDGHFVVGGRNIFIEYKGYPEEGHILATMMAAQLIKKKLGSNTEFYLIVHIRENLERMTGAKKLIEAYCPKYINAVFGLDCLEEFIKVLK